MKKHGSVAYAKANHAFKDHTCQKGIADARDLHQHMIAMVSSGSHLQVIFSGFDVAKIVTMSLCTSGDPQLLDAGPAGVAVPHAIDILRSSVCHPPPPRTYHFHLLSRKLLITNDLLTLWENEVRSIRMAFQLPEILARCFCPYRNGQKPIDVSFPRHLWGFDRLAFASWTPVPREAQGDVFDCNKKRDNSSDLRVSSQWESTKGPPAQAHAGCNGDGVSDTQLWHGKSRIYLNHLREDDTGLFCSFVRPRH